MRARVVIVVVVGLHLLLTGLGSVAVAAGRAKFIVVFDESVRWPNQVAADHARHFGADVTQVYQHVLKGYAARLDASQLAALKSDRRVALVEPDQVATAVSVDASQEPGLSSRAVQTITDPGLWGLDRIDQRSLPLDSAYVYSSDGSGVIAYVLGTGLSPHADFQGRASAVYDVLDDGQNGFDCNGHGTHVAGTVGSATHGVAKGVTIKAVRVLDCTGSGSYSGIIEALDWVLNDYLNSPSSRAVVNMSLGGGFSEVLNNAVNNAAQVIPVVVEAGNSAADACNDSPSSASQAITVGAATAADSRASYSNWGPCVDLFAPGSGVKSTWLNFQTNTISGTGMATPHVAGVVAQTWQEFPGLTASQIATKVVDRATCVQQLALPPPKGKAKKNPPITLLRLLFSHYDGSSMGLPTPPETDPRCSTL